MSAAFSTFNTGHDVSVVITDPATGRAINIPILTGWDKKPLYDSVKSRPLNGPPIFEEDPAGWELSFDFDRSNPDVDNLVAAREEAFYAGQTIGQATVLETIQEVGGTYTQWAYTGAALKLDDGGRFKRGETVQMKMSALCGRRKKRN